MKQKIKMTKKELKTLKDIEGDYCPQCKLWSDAINPGDLKQVAIEWIKLREIDHNVAIQFKDKDVIMACFGSIRDFKKIFNITEEDLK